jgi:1,4-alpha-glucan branching enzyme
MHDTLRYMSREPVHRRFHHHELTFRMLYAFNENFVLPLSHDEVVHGKRSLLEKMPGDAWQKHANMRLLVGYMYGQAGKKLLFMGAELAQPGEWQHDESLAWHLLDTAGSAGVQACVRDLNRLYASERALHERDCDPAGFEWVDANDADHSVISFLRLGGGESVLVICNFTPVPRHNYRVGVPVAGFWRELLNTDAHDYGGSGQGNFGGVDARAVTVHGRPYSLAVTLPPLAAIFLKAPLSA